LRKKPVQTDVDVYNFIVYSAYTKQNKYQLSLTNQRDALHHGKRAANKGGRSL